MLILLLMLVAGEFEGTGTIKLGIPTSPRPPLMFIDKKKNIWYRSLWEHHIYKLAPDGREIFRFGGEGHGPGELIKPNALTLANEERWVLVSESGGRLSVFDAESGKFLKVLKSWYPLMRMYPWDENKVLVLASPLANVAQGFNLMDFRTGEIKKKWFRMKEPRSKVTCSQFALAMMPDRRIFYQPGCVPEVWVVTPFKDEAQIWELLPPLHYREPPDRPLAESARYSRYKVDEYYESFTQLSNFVVLEERYLLVCWKINEPYPYIYQLYDIPEKKLVKANFQLKGRLTAVQDGLIYTWERTDPESDAEDQKDLLHTYRFVND